MIAARDLKDSTRVGVQALLDVFHPRPVHANRHMVFSLAGNSTGVASDALAVVDDEAVFHLRKFDRNKPSY